MDLFSSDLVRPLRIAENDSLEVLVSQFSLSRLGRGSELTVSFDADTPAIWRNKAKWQVQRMMPDFERKASAYQQEMDTFLLRSEGNTYRFDDPDFPFRYASGGALPVVRLGEEEYYCLFYRDIFPFGWNIANGGCDDRYELLNPFDAMERELREELIVIAPGKGKSYVFEADAGKPLDRPEFAIARRFWQERFPRLNLDKFQELRIPLKWLDGPDRLIVQFQGEQPRAVDGCFLNINAADYGIEVDKIAKLNLDEDVVLLDGEIKGGRLLNAPVGLFQVHKLNRELSEGKTEYLPDIFFQSANRYDGNEKLEQVIRDDFLRPIASKRTPEEVARYESCQNKFDLCPVTSRIIKRYLSQQTEALAIEPGPFDVFISFGGEDRDVAEKVYEFLRGRGKKAFFSKESIGHSDFGKAIDDALDSARCLIAVATRPENLRRRWVEFEWRSFHLDILNERKDEGRLVSFISGFSHLDLPRVLSYYQAVKFDQDNLKAGLRELVRYVP